MKLPQSEIKNRIDQFYKLMNEKAPGWDIAVIFDRVNQYYFTGTMQNSVLIFLPSGRAHYFVRKSYARAMLESGFPDIRQMNTFRDIVTVLGDKKLENGYIEKSKVPIGLFEMLNKYLNIENVQSLDEILSYQRSIKSPYEIEIMKEVGARHNKFVREIVPGLLKERMSELELASLYGYEMIKFGHQGIHQFNMFQANPSSGEIAFGDNSMYPSSFDGPGGTKGIYPAQPKFGSAERTLQPGDLVYADWDFTMQGYHTDITQIYMFKGKISDEIKAANDACIKIKKLASGMLKPGAIPSDIYNAAIDILDKKYLNHFMGANGENVKFIGHGLGLCVDELPVIAPKYNVPLEANMTIAIEPKISIEGVGLVGVESTYIVTEHGGECITGETDEIIEVF
ncbi:MAG: aminopeptidase P family protein [Clostridia bacterium]|nr:aminopeptidase P family protein [Clostridia bacterium]